MKPKQETRVVEVYASTTGNQVTLTWRRWSHKLGQAERIGQETRMVRATMPVPLTNDDLSKYAEAMARFCVDPRRRLFRPPNALVWREIPFGNDETHEHGESKDGIQMLPLWQSDDQGITGTDIGSTIDTRPSVQGTASAKRTRSSAREPSIRTLGSGKRQSAPGG